MSPLCPKCGELMSSVREKVFECAPCRELLQFLSVKELDVSLPWADSYCFDDNSERIVIAQTAGSVRGLE